MIYGDYPCCNQPFVALMPERTPVYEKETCPHCGAIVWHRLARVMSKSWTEADFLATHTVDQATKLVTPNEFEQAAIETDELLLKFMWERLGVKL